MSCKYMFKYIIIGDTGVGKSCILSQFLAGKFNPNYDVTVGVEFGAKMIKIFDEPVKQQIWDTAGQETFKSITRSYYRSAAGALQVYDITSRETFNHIQSWLNEVREHGNNKMSILLIGNKSDLEKQRQVPREMAENFAQKNDQFFIETSAKVSTSIETSFLKVGEMILDKINKNQIDVDNESFGVRRGNQSMDRGMAGMRGMDTEGRLSSSGKINTKKKGDCC